MSMADNLSIEKWSGNPAATGPESGKTPTTGACGYLHDPLHLGLSHLEGIPNSLDRLDKDSLGAKYTFMMSI